MGPTYTAALEYVNPINGRWLPANACEVFNKKRLFNETIRNAMKLLKKAEFQAKNDSQPLGKHWIPNYYFFKDQHQIQDVHSTQD